MPPSWNSLTCVRTALATRGSTFLPIEVFFGLHILCARAADQKDGGFGRRLVPDVQTALGFSVDRPGRGDGEARSISPLVSASQASTFLCVNINVMMPSGFRVAAALGKDGGHPLLVVPARDHADPFSPLNRAGLATASLSLSVRFRRNSSGEDMPCGALEPDVRRSPTAQRT